MMTYKLNEIFELIETSQNQAVIKVNADTLEKAARFPFISRDYAFITVTRGFDDHFMTIIRGSGKTTSIEWGRYGETLFSKRAELLKNQVIRFLEQNGVLIDCNSYKASGATIYYNHNYKKWQLTLKFAKGNAHYWSETAGSLGDMVDEVEGLFVKADEWETKLCSMGFFVWEAKNPTYIYK